MRKLLIPLLVISASLAVAAPAVAAGGSRADAHRTIVRLQRRLDLTVQHYDHARASEQRASTRAQAAARAYRSAPPIVRDSKLGNMLEQRAERLEAAQSDSWIAIGRMMGLSDRIRGLIAHERQILRSLPKPLGHAFFSSAPTDGTTAAGLRQLAASGVLRGDDPGRRAVRVALRELGVAYRWGGESPTGFDCSGLTQWAYAQTDTAIPRTAAAQMAAGTPVAANRLRPGDLVFFERGIGHVAMYVGDGLIIEAPHTGAVVWLAYLGDSWHRDNYQGAVQPW